MAWPVFPSLPLSPEQTTFLLTRLADGRQGWGPLAGGDGIWRLQPGGCPRSEVAQLPLIPLKKLLVPDGDPLWSWGPAGYVSPASPPAVLLVGVSWCDLQALTYLDRVFADDGLYHERRSRLLVIGAPCVPVAECACQPGGLVPGGDLFQGDGRLWALSPVGEAILREEGRGQPVELVPLPGPTAGTVMAPVSEAQFLESAGSPLWGEAAVRCVACGACSAVCPTCSCYEVLDEARLDGSVTRRRVWDNCFFPEYARVAGGYDFRAGRAARLRFRFEHKRLGFGALRGIPSCVGCGRCRRACPVGIDLEPVARRLVGETSG